MTDTTAAEAAGDYAAGLSAALSLGFLAADFIRQPETMPVFKAWVKTVTSPGNPDLEYFAAMLDSDAAAHLSAVLNYLMLGVQDTRGLL